MSGSEGPGGEASSVSPPPAHPSPHLYSIPFNVFVCAPLAQNSRGSSRVGAARRIYGDDVLRDGVCCDRSRLDPELWCPPGVLRRDPYPLLVAALPMVRERISSPPTQAAHG